MNWKKFEFTKIENNSDFVTRVLIVSFPSAMVFILLAFFDLLTPYWAVVSYAMILVFNAAFLLPISSELEQVKKYIVNLSKGENNQEFDLEFSEQEAREIAEAVNSMHKFWVYKTDALEAQSMSDTAVLDTLPDPILMIDRSGNILGANLSTRKLLGENVTTKNIENVFDSHNFIKAVTKVLKKETESENLIFYAKEPFNKKIYAHIKQLPWFSKGRAVAVISLYDLTKATKLEKMQSDFVANASHELRTPLSVISGFIETLQTSAKDDKQAQETFLKIMADQAEYMSALIENLLSLSRIELSQDDAPKDEVNVDDIIDDVVSSLSLKADEANMHIVLEKNDKTPFVLGDKHQIRQLIQNLTDNALKYGVASSDVTIGVKLVKNIPSSKAFTVADGKAVAISVNNKGPKISPEDLSRLTERFYRLQEHKNMNIKGTGLGLSIAKQIILRHRGNLTVTSSNYDGTTFTVYLPIK
ncbi:MAG: hypothetical protein IJF12_05365 [Alphaproteobacteria bacterium]|nr:hypothetical protein [Alphaproteobacteria bacterium]